MNENENNEKPEWPREVCIRQTLDSIAAELGDDYDEDDNNGLVATAIVDSMSTVEIESWEEIPDGYELFHREDQEDYQAYLESIRRESGQLSNVIASMVSAVELYLDEYNFSSTDEGCARCIMEAEYQTLAPDGNELAKALAEALAILKKTNKISAKC